MAEVIFEMIPQSTLAAGVECADTYADQIENEDLAPAFDDIIFERAQQMFSNDDPDAFATNERELYFAAAQTLAERGIVIDAAD
jgi:hypothetical protein